MRGIDSTLLYCRATPGPLWTTNAVGIPPPPRSWRRERIRRIPAPDRTVLTPGGEIIEGARGSTGYKAGATENGSGWPVGSGIATSKDLHGDNRDRRRRPGHRGRGANRPGARGSPCPVRRRVRRWIADRAGARDRPLDLGHHDGRARRRDRDNARAAPPRIRRADPHDVEHRQCDRLRLWQGRTRGAGRRIRRQAGNALLVVSAT